jgi:hypothetical protein
LDNQENLKTEIELYIQSEKTLTANNKKTADEMKRAAVFPAFIFSVDEMTTPGSSTRKTFSIFIFRVLSCVSWLKNH